MLNVLDLNVQIDDNEILSNVSFKLNENDFLTILGPNGSGKTTIVKCIMNDIKYSGIIKLNDIVIKKIKLEDLAKNIGVLTQNYNIEFDTTVYDVVSLGRYSYVSDMFGKLKNEDFEKIDEVMNITDVYRLKDKSINNISGGELQRVFLAQVLAQDPNVLILDEPTNHLDIKHQIDIFNILKKWSQINNKAVIAIVHDLNLAFEYSTMSLLISEGKMVKFGKIEQVLTRENLKKSYEVDVYDWMYRLMSHWK